MRLLGRFLLGVAIGAAVGVAVSVWLAPLSGPELRSAARRRWRAALDEGRRAQIATEQRIFEEYRAARQPVGQATR